MILLTKKQKFLGGGKAMVYGNRDLSYLFNQTKQSLGNPDAFADTGWMSNFNQNQSIGTELQDASPPDMTSTDSTLNGGDVGLTLKQPDTEKSSFGEKLGGIALNNLTGDGTASPMSGAINYKPSTYGVNNNYDISNIGKLDAPDAPIIQAPRPSDYNSAANMNNLSLAGNNASTSGLASNIAGASGGGIAQQAMGTGSSAAASASSGMAGAGSVAGAASTAGKGLSGVNPGLSAGIGIASQVGVAAIDHFQKRKIDSYGVEKVNTGAEIGKSALQGAVMGGSVGSVVPVIGTAIGAGVGAVIGAVGGIFKSKKMKRKARKLRAKVRHQRREASIGEDVAQSAALGFGRDGMKLRVNSFFTKLPKSSVAILRNGGKIQKLEEGGKMNIIPKGKLHTENNNLGNKDKGIPVVSKDGGKIFELEKEELILHLAATEKIEEMVTRYQESEDEAVLAELGKYITNEIVNNTDDKTGVILDTEKGGKK